MLSPSTRRLLQQLASDGRKLNLIGLPLFEAILQTEWQKRWLLCKALRKPPQNNGFLRKGTKPMFCCGKRLTQRITMQHLLHHLFEGVTFVCNSSVLKGTSMEMPAVDITSSCLNCNESRFVTCHLSRKNSWPSALTSLKYLHCISSKNF